MNYVFIWTRIHINLVGAWPKELILVLLNYKYYDKLRTKMVMGYRHFPLILSVSNLGNISGPFLKIVSCLKQDTEDSIKNT